MKPRVALSFADDAIDSRPLDSTYSTICACAFDDDRVDPSPRYRRILAETTASDNRDAATCPAFVKLNGNIVPHRENK